MHPHFENAAQILFFLHRAGLDVGTCHTVMTLLSRFAELLDHLHSDAKGLTHIGAATWILDDLEKRKLVRCESAKRQKILAVLGTAIANHTTAGGRRTA